MYARSKRGSAGRARGARPPARRRIGGSASAAVLGLVALVGAPTSLADPIAVEVDRDADGSYAAVSVAGAEFKVWLPADTRTW